MKLKQNQLILIRHLAQFGTLDYHSCLLMLDDDKIKASYAFRPLTKNKYISKHENGSVTILAKGRALFPDVKPLVKLGGGSISRVNSISRTAMFLRKFGIESVESPELARNWCFVPSTCWRKIRHGILSTTRFTGILFINAHRLAVYDIADGTMDWQLRAERSLFYIHFHEEQHTHATGMLFICDEDKRVEIAQRIIRETMYRRKQIIEYESNYEETRPIKYARTPIRVAWYYKRVYLTTPSRIKDTLDSIAEEEAHIRKCRGNEDYSFDNSKNGDFYYNSRWVFVNLTTDLLKYVYFFADLKDGIKRSIIVPREDLPIAEMYPKIIEGVDIYEYQCI